ncbi:MAG: PAS domain S-box protein, partial [Burkholderiales bacterium]|nr:PAS domain S-box protein [Burkholderiales bacterium]MCW5620624.1 PAS domain S-box protein [Burkholderiales bacterium]
MDKARSVRRDLLLVGAITILSFILAAAFEFREWMAEVTDPLEPYQVDELPFVFAVLAIAMSWFSWRRWRHAHDELRLRITAQEALAERERQYRMLLMEDLAGNAVTSQDGVIKLCNPAMARMLGLAHPDQAVGRNIAEFYASREQWRSQRRALEQGERVEVPVLTLESQDGMPVKVIARILPPRAPRHQSGLHVYFVDISDLQRTQRELADSLSENRLLSQKYVMVQEAERRNLAREMHDELGQCLNAIKLDAVSIREVTHDRVPEAEASANAIVELSAHVYDVVRGIMQRLRPAALDTLGLHDAVGQLVGQWQRRNRNVECRYESSGDLSGLGEALNITVYRLVQECLTNIVKHADATHVLVELHRTSESEVR